LKIGVLDLTTDRKWRSCIGLDAIRFYKLLPLFSLSYEELFEESITSKQSENPAGNSKITTYEDLLFFTLFSLKSGLTYDVLGLVTGLDGSNAKRNQERGLQVLKHALGKASVLPKREFKTVEEFNIYFAGKKELLLDGLEQRIQRPSDYDVQKGFYSGKKNVTPSKQ
jgi:hypothetical protein